MHGHEALGSLPSICSEIIVPSLFPCIRTPNIHGYDILDGSSVCKVGKKLKARIILYKFCADCSILKTILCICREAISNIVIIDLSATSPMWIRGNKNKNGFSSEKSEV
jgi:hypothetical protein